MKLRILFVGMSLLIGSWALAQPAPVKTFVENLVTNCSGPTVENTDFLEAVDKSIKKGITPYLKSKKPIAKTLAEGFCGYKGYGKEVKVLAFNPEFLKRIKESMKKEEDPEGFQALQGQLFQDLMTAGKKYFPIFVLPAEKIANILSEIAPKRCGKPINLAQFMTAEFALGLQKSLLKSDGIKSAIVLTEYTLDETALELETKCDAHGNQHVADQRMEDYREFKKFLKEIPSTSLPY